MFYLFVVYVSVIEVVSVTGIVVGVDFELILAYLQLR